MIRLGIERVSEYREVFSGKKLGMITAPSGTDQKLHSSAELFMQQYPLSAFYGPEHGIRGEADAGDPVDGVMIDVRTGLPMYSLYRTDSKDFTADMLEGIDALVYDIQDLGLRFYTYISTMVKALEACTAYGKELIILDRPNPLGGQCIDGGRLHNDYESFVGCYDIPIRYGLTIGELAMMVHSEQKMNCKLTVIPMTGWTRDLLFPDLGYPFLMPSPSIPNFHNAMLYAGTCLLEGTNISEGRGTSDPFAILGAPFIDAFDLCDALHSLRIPGVLITPTFFTPSASKHAGSPCQGVHLHLTSPSAYPAVSTGVQIIDTLRTLYPKDFSYASSLEVNHKHMLDLLSGSDALRTNLSTEPLLEEWKKDSLDFEERSSSYHLYGWR
ncbi:MAG: DUF1343 domain-containing protein [Clostridiales bacterium]|nr:DUF1343 domain-containing protein [Clostridiales bacterium]